MSVAPVQLAGGVWRLPTVGKSAVNSFAFVEADGSVTLLDTGYKGGPKKLAAHLSAIGSSPEAVKQIIVSHAHGDHVGGLAGMVARAGQARVFASAEEAQYVTAGKTPPPDPALLMAKILRFLGSSFPPAAVDETFTDGQTLDVLGGLDVIHTPGHTPGHCSFLHRPSGILITGDALFNWRNKIAYSVSFFCSNYKQSQQTAERLGEAEYETAAFTHGPEIRDNAREQVRQFLRRR